MRYASGITTTMASREGRMTENNRPGCLPEVCEVTGEPLFRAGDYAAPGEYQEIETRRSVRLVVPDFLPARLDGKVACYRLLRRGWETTDELSLMQKQSRFHALMAHSHQRLYRFVRRTLNNPQDAEDVTQEALARAWSHFDSFDPQHSFEAWIFRIARNLSIDQNRRRRRRQELSLDALAADLDGFAGVCRRELADSKGEPEKCLMTEEISVGLLFALHSLPTMYRKTLELIAQQHSYAEIARELNCAVGTVRSRVHRARALIKRNLKESILQDQHVGL